MGNPLDNFNKIPKKYRTVVLYGGIGTVGFIAYRRWRSAEDMPVDNAAPTADTDTLTPAPPGAAPIYVVGGNNAGNSDNENSGGDYFGLIQGLSDSYLGATENLFGTLTGGFNTLLAAGQANEDRWHNTIMPIISAGMTPQPAPNIIINPALFPEQAPAPPAPIATAPMAAAPAANTGPPGFPKFNKAKGTWYKDAVATTSGTDINGKKYKKGDSINVYYGGAVVKD